ncbi:SpoIVB peptidase [Clostridium sp. LY3-2]|uniref:SpoIVB peptidase n=1 Tax=Clostridium sp. LY3-2 TaxID=2942482 RepID=UPI002152EB5A|nr:SpoIVB peptidase [Clostridium sp. LY3-2]MCR6515852.1 SpoIVB peptidase [Clostridium sp. LY3-2]
MIKRYVSKVSLVVTLILVVLVPSIFTIKDLPDKIYISDSVCSKSVFKDLSPFNKVTYSKDSLDIKFMGLINLKSVQLKKYENLKIIPGGDSVGVKIASDGVLVVGFSKINCNGNELDSTAKKSGIEVGDRIIEVDNKSVINCNQLSQKILESKNKSLNIKLIRDGELLSKRIEIIKEKSENKIGLWVRDSTAGVGTMTFIDKNTKNFGALGHPITDSDTNKLFNIKDGDLFDSAIISLRKGEKGNPGELKGIFTNENNPLGDIKKNTSSGIFGNLENNEKFTKNKELQVGFRDEVKEGKAKIITTIDEKGPKEYEIEIIKKLEQQEAGPKSMIIKITDEKLLKETGGIIQGMSGSPIIQNNKIIGAVTHVLINKPDVGYGIYIEWMLQDAGVIN